MRRLVLLTPLALLLLGPAPGDTGGCAGDETVRVDPGTFCEEQGRFNCQRLSFQNPPPEGYPGLQACVDERANFCSNVDAWPGDCFPEPTARELDNCIEALRLAENVDAELEDISECDVCP
ncbi:MAG: hypothetical protein AAF447_20675 [Myxococcota bacterium]